MNIKENDYSSKVDCKLNYFNIEEMISLFQEANFISPKSVYRFLEELGNPPTGNYQLKSLKKNIQTVLNYVDDNFNHELKEIAFMALNAKFNKNHLSIKKSLKLMKEVQKYFGYYSLLNIINYSTRRTRNIKIVEETYNTIIQQWLQN